MSAQDDRQIARLEAAILHLLAENDDLRLRIQRLEDRDRDRTFARAVAEVAERRAGRRAA